MGPNHPATLFGVGVGMRWAIVDGMKVRKPASYVGYQNSNIRQRSYHDHNDYRPVAA